MIIQFVQGMFRLYMEMLWNLLLHIITMFAKETKLENNLFLNTKELIRILTQNHLSFGSSVKLEKFFFRAAKNLQLKNFNRLLEFYDFFFDFFN